MQRLPAQMTVNAQKITPAALLTRTERTPPQHTIVVHWRMETVANLFAVPEVITVVMETVVRDVLSQKNSLKTYFSIK